eukprot:jgi/Ulvmu1/9250/UM005_0350.1
MMLPSCSASRCKGTCMLAARQSWRAAGVGTPCPAVAPRGLDRYAPTTTAARHRITTASRTATVPHAAAAPPAAATELLTSTRDVASGTISIDSHSLEDGSVTVTIDCTRVPDPNNLVLHWGVSASATRPHEWMPPPEAIRPPNTNMFGDGLAARSPIPGHEPLVVRVPADIVADKGGPQSLVGIIVRSVNGQEEDWLHADDGMGDVEAPLRPPPPPPPAHVRAALLAERVAEQEAGQDMNLFARYCMVNDSIGEAISDPDPGSMAVILAWLRLNASRQLDWYAGGNYQGKDMAHMQKTLATQMATHCRGDGLKAHLARMSLAVLPRGGGDGDAIRMTILDLLRNNGIKEGHRPGIECPFLAQWHQKLHSNTTLDDIAICEAYLHFLHGSGDFGDFWWHIYENHGLTPEDLAAMKAGWRTQGITGPAVHLPFLIPAVQHLHWVLKIAHSGSDMDTALTMARGCLPGDLQWDIDDLLNNRHEWWVPGKIVSIRERLSPVWRSMEDMSALRSVMLLDISLEMYFRTRMEGADVDTIGRDDVLGMLELVLQGHCISAGCTPEVAAAAGGLRRLMHEPPASARDRWSQGWALAAVAVLDNVAQAVANHLDTICGLVQMPADMFGEKVAKVDHKYIANFGEEVARGHPLYVASALLAKLQREAREAAGLGPWEVISSGGAAGGPAVGRVVVSALADMQGASAPADGVARVVLSEELGGLEDVPPGVAAVLTTSPVDLLSHIAIRARNTGVLLATCSDDALWQELVGGKTDRMVAVALGPGAGEVQVTAAPEGAGAAAASGGDGAAAPVQLKQPGKTDKWALRAEEFEEGLVGGKSLGVKRLSELTGSGYAVPPAFALPYGAFERALEAAPQHAKDAFSASVEALQSVGGPSVTDLDMPVVRSALAEVRTAVAGLPLPSALREEVAAAASAAGPPLAAWGSIEDDAGGATGDGADAWRAIKAVWASKWTERAFLNRRAAGIPEADLSMAVLCMALLPADYAFVLHSRSPLDPGSSDVFGEVVVGLGETLVGNEPGRAFSFSAPRGGGAPATLALPSKLHAHTAPAAGESPLLIARSDSNGEDLEGFAGAGLYESVTTRATAVRAVNYAGEPLLWDDGFRAGLASRLAALAEAVETAAGAPQDIEGCVVGDEVFLLQSRAQV